MTKRQLLDSADSLELSEWLAFFPVRDRVHAEARRQAQQDAAFEGSDA